MQIRNMGSSLAVAAAAFGLGGIDSAVAADKFGGLGICCEMGGNDWRAPSLRDCRRYGGHYISPRRRACRLGPPSDTPQVRHQDSVKTIGSDELDGGPRVRQAPSGKGPQVRGSTRTVDSRELGGGPRVRRADKGIPDTKPSGSSARRSSTKPIGKGCKPRLTVTRHGAYTKVVGLQTARAAWGAEARLKHGLGYPLSASQGRRESCKRGRLMVECTVSAIPCQRD